MATTDPLMTPAELSEYLQVPTGTLSQWRHRDTGPACTRVGRHVRYRRSEVERWLDAQTDRATPAA